MLILSGLIVFAIVVLALERRFRDSRITLRSCCSQRPWPPDDLTERSGGLDQHD